MMIPNLKYLLLCGLLAGVSLPVSAALTAAEQQKRIKDVEGLLRQSLAKEEGSVASPKQTYAVRNLSHAALAYMMLGEGADKGVAKAQAMVEHFFPLQDMDVNSPNYGKVPWDPSKPNLHDDNAIEFLASELGPLFILYGDKFPQSFRDEAAPHLKAALVAIARHRIDVTYTNIALMKSANQILLGEYLKDNATIDLGKALLDEWITYTRKNGIHEFNSPTYSQTQIDVLYGLYHTVKDPVVKAKAKVALDYYWGDLSANYFPGSRSMSGPNSRTYKFLSERANIDHIYYLNGFSTMIDTAGVFLNDQVQIWAPAVWNDYTPPAAALALAHEPTRLIQQRCGEKPNEDWTNYITPDFAIGSSSRSSGAQDRLVVALLASATKEMPVISVVPDMCDSPYGKFAMLENGGHKKIMHLEAVTSAVQNKGQVLAIYDLAPPLAKKEVASVATNVVFPFNAAAITLNGAPVKWGDGTVPVPADSVLCVREGNGAVAIRLFAEAAPGSKVSYFLKKDGEAWDAARLVAYQYEGAPAKLTPPSLHSGVLLLASPCKTDTDVEKLVKQAKAWTFTQAEEGKLWKVTARQGSDAKADVLEASIDTAAKQTGPRRVNGKEVALPVLEVNGVDWSEKIWKTLPQAAPQANK